MKIRILTGFIVLFLSIASYPQERPAAVLIDEFQSTTCEEIWARLDNLLVQLRNNPGATATISFTGKTGELHNDLYYESMMRIYAIDRKVSAKNWKIVRGEPAPDRLIRFYLTLPNGLLPELTPSDWSLVYPPKTKHFIFFLDSEVDSGICLRSNQMGLFADVLKANPQSHANVVLYASSNREFKQRGRAVVKMWKTNYGIKKSQIRLFRKPPPGQYDCSSCDEYWFVP